MSIPAYEAAWKVYDIPSHLKFVLVALADFANEDGLCFPSYETIAKRCNINRRMAIYSVKSLVKLGLVKKCKRYLHDTNQTSNYYILTIVKTHTSIRPLW